MDATVRKPIVLSQPSADPVPWLTAQWDKATIEAHVVSEAQVAKALSAVQKHLNTFVVGLSDAGHSYRVVLGGGGDMPDAPASTVYAQGTVFLGTKPWTHYAEGALSFGQLVAIFTGLAYHEVGHIRFDEHDALTHYEWQATCGLKDKGALRFISNITRDIRLEGRMVEAFPGFADALGIAYWWVANGMAEARGFEQNPVDLSTRDGRGTAFSHGVRYPMLTDWDGFESLREEWADYAARAAKVEDLEALHALITEAYERICDDSEPEPEPEPEPQPDPSDESEEDDSDDEPTEGESDDDADGDDADDDADEISEDDGEPKGDDDADDAEDESSDEKDESDAEGDDEEDSDEDAEGDDADGEWDEDDEDATEGSDGTEGEDEADEPDDESSDGAEEPGEAESEDDTDTEGDGGDPDDDTDTEGDGEGDDGEDADGEPGEAEGDAEGDGEADPDWDVDMDPDDESSDDDAEDGDEADSDAEGSENFDAQDTEGDADPDGDTEGDVEAELDVPDDKGEYSLEETETSVSRHDADDDGSEAAEDEDIFESPELGGCVSRMAMDPSDAERQLSIDASARAVKHNRERTFTYGITDTLGRTTEHQRTIREIRLRRHASEVYADLLAPAKPEADGFETLLEAAPREVTADIKYGRYGYISANTRLAQRTKHRPDAERALAAVMASSRKGPGAPEFAQRNGRIDRRRLGRLSYGEPRVFIKPNAAAPRRVSVGVLLDASGSMLAPPAEVGLDGELKYSALPPKVEIAAQVGRDLAGAIESLDWCRGMVSAHTTTGGPIIVPLWKSGEPTEWMDDILVMPHAGNEDGFAIGFMAEDLLEGLKRDEKALLIVVSDGAPAYGGSENHVRSTVDAYRKRGVRIVSVSLEGSMNSATQNHMYGANEVVPYSHSVSAFAQSLARVIGSSI